MFQGITRFGDFPVLFVVGPIIPLTALPVQKGYFGVRAAIVLVFSKKLQITNIYLNARLL